MRRPIRNRLLGLRDGVSSGRSAAIRRKATSLLWILAALAASSCALSPAPQDAFYRLESSPPTRALERPALEGILEVGALRADPLIGGRAMLYRTSRDSPQVHRHPYSIWSDAPPSMLQAELATCSRAAGAAPRIVTPAARTQADFALSGTIHRLERIIGGAPSVLIEVELSLVKRRTRELLLLEVYREELDAGGPGVEHAVGAFGRGLSKICDRFIEDLAAIRAVLPSSPRN